MDEKFMEKQKENAKKAKISARRMPHRLESEQALLGCVLIDKDAPVTILNEVTSNDFYGESHQHIFDAMQSLFIQGKNIDYVSLADELESKGLLEAVGGISYISSLTNIVPSAADFKQYMDIVKRNSTARRLISASQDIIDKVFETDGTEDVLTMAEAKIYAIAEKNDKSKLEPIKESLGDVVEKFRKLVKDPESLQGIPTGFVGLDKLLNGLQKSDLIFLAARPGMGKTSLAMNIAMHVAIEEHKTCAIFSLEMPSVQLAQRALCSVANVSMEKALRAQLTETEWRKLFDAVTKMSEANIFIDDSSLNTPAGILSKCRRLKREKGLDFVMIDYLQLMTMGKHVESRQNEVSEISRNLKILAKELDVPVLVLSQLNRQIDTRKGAEHKPVFSDLRESGSIEQDADIILFIYERDTAQETEIKKDGIRMLSVAKHRNGPTGDIELFWQGDTTTFHNTNRASNFASLEQTLPKLKPNEQGLDNATAEEIIPTEDYKNLVPPMEDGASFEDAAEVLDQIFELDDEE